MNKTTACFLPVTALVLLSVIMRAEIQSEPTVHPLAGTWQLERAEVAQPDGTIAVDPNYGPHAKGLMIVDRSGRYSLQIFRPDRPKFISGDKSHGTSEEYKSALVGMSTHTGLISVDETNHTLTFHIDLAAFPNWEHTKQTRAYQLLGDELSYRIPPRPSGASPISIWHRVNGGH